MLEEEKNILEEERLGGLQMITNRLKELRKKRNIKVQKLIEKLDIAQSYYYDIENGSKRLNEDLLHKLANYYKVTTDYILGRTEAENNIIVEGDSIPEELKPYIEVLSINKDHILTPDELKQLIEIAMMLKVKN